MYIEFDQSSSLTHCMYEHINTKHNYVTECPSFNDIMRVGYREMFVNMSLDFIYTILLALNI